MAENIMLKQTDLTLIRLRENNEWKNRASAWFSQKWEIPAAAYEESMQECMENGTGVPQWYVIVNREQEIIAGAGVIENDFHDRKDLTPNLCALFVEEPMRHQGIARRLLDVVREDMAKMGVETLYLVTDHEQFYEKCGWEFLTMVRGEDGEAERMYMAAK